MKKIVLLVVCMIGFAIGGEHVIGGATGSNFSTDSLSADSIGVGWPNALKIEVGDSIYTSLIDTIFSDTATGFQKSAQASPLVKSRGDGKFTVVYLHKDDRPTVEPWTTGVINQIIMKDYSVVDVDVILDDEKIIAKDEYLKLDNQNSPITSIDFDINPDGDKWAVYWNSAGTDLRRTWDNRMTAITEFNASERGEFIDTLGATTRQSIRTNICIAYPSNGYGEAYVVHSEENPPFDNRLVISRNILNSTTAQKDATPVQVRHDMFGANFMNGIACTVEEATGHLVVAFNMMVGALGLVDPITDLNIATFDPANNFAMVVPQTKVAGNVQAGPKDRSTAPKGKPFEIVDLGNRKIGIVWTWYHDATRRDVYFVNFDTQTQTFSPVDGPLISDALFPSIAVDSTKTHVVISAMKKYNAVAWADFGWNLLTLNSYTAYPYGIVTELNPGTKTLNMASPMYNDSLSFERTTFNSIDPDWRPFFLWSTVTPAIDEHKNAVFVYNQEHNAKILVYKEVKIYKAAAHYQSTSSLKISDSFGPGVVEPFVAGVDEVQFSMIDYGCAPACDTNIFVLVEQASNAGFTDTYTTPFDSTTGVVTPNALFSGEYYRYGVRMRSYYNFKKSPVLDSIRFAWNVRPRRPVIDSVKVGGGSWVNGATAVSSALSVINRLDTVYVAASAYDHDNETGLSLIARAGASDIHSVTGLMGASGHYSSLIKITPKDTVDSAYVVSLFARDAQGWESNKGVGAVQNSVTLNYVNRVPQYTMQITVPRIVGLDSLDTTLVGDGTESFFINVGDTAWVTVTTRDTNDAQLDVSWVDSDALILGNSDNNKADSLYRFPVLPDPIDTDPYIILSSGADVTPDTVRITIGDKNDQITGSFRLVPNHYPTLDSVISILPWNIYGVTTNDTIDINDNPGTLFWNDVTNPDREDRDLDIHPFINVKLEAVPYDIDVINNDSTTIDWRFLRVDSNNICCVTDSMYILKIPEGDTIIRDTTYRGDALTYVFELNPPDIEIETCDFGGACIRDTLKIRYPRLDTQLAAEGNFSQAKASMESLSLILGSERTKDTVHMVLYSKGTRDLEIYSVRTTIDEKTKAGTDYASWLNYIMQWDDQTKPVRERTDSNHLTNSIKLSDGDSLAFDFYWDVSSESGDRILRDTLLIYTNDFFQPLLKIPFKVEFNDLPKINIMRVSSDFSDTTNRTDLSHNVGSSVPQYSSFQITFTEPVMRQSLNDYLKIYSYKDSLKYCEDYANDPVCQSREIPERARIGSWENYRTAFSGFYFTANTPRDYKNRPLVTMTDTLTFLPYYSVCSYFEKILPVPYSLIKGDEVRIWVSNSIRDSVGTRLDLERDYVKDTTEVVRVYPVNVLATPFRVLSTVPEKGSADDIASGDPLSVFAADGEIQINFNNRIIDTLVFGVDTASRQRYVPVDVDSLGAGKNRTIRISTAFNGWKDIDLKYVRRANNDSAIVVRPKRKFYSKDTVMVTVVDSIVDIWGRSLDGDESELGTWIIQKQSGGCKDTTFVEVDSYSFKFVINPTAFYLYPNPFKFENRLHQQKTNEAGEPCMEFKNLNSISSSISVDEEIHIRVYNVLGQLIYSSARTKESLSYSSEDTDGTPRTFCWNMKNSSGRGVVTGVYMFTIGTDDDGILKKGKLAIVR